MDDRSSFMKSSIDHLPPPKQRELTRTVEVLLEEFDDALKAGDGEQSQADRFRRLLAVCGRPPDA
ncbi:hypothetical protein [Mesorhizobium ciceri]|uniref:hypothetical protein n=1 Tax=Mesorhizobium TaxID=68287 RepID=UPI0007A9415C|nr:hypothetical protein A4R28_30485 [Mesorhizobium ciceri]AMY03953.1 hypothetical protein A4R29_30085 [Mesorhizobium ciceri biovar biserrulae]